MAEQTVTGYFEGVPCMVDFSLTLGITPGSGTLSFADSWSIPKIGTLIISDGVSNVIIDKVYAVNPRIEEDAQSGSRWVVTVYDRRFVWKWGHINGTYNPESVSGAPTKDTTLYDLLGLCLEALGEPSSGRYLIPATYPKVEWEMENPAKALNDLCEEFGLVIGMRASSPNEIVIGPYDDPAVFPSIVGTTSTVEMITGDIVPSEIILTSDRIRVQYTFEDLIPVGIDTDGYIKHIDDLSYKPAGADGFPDEVWGKEIMSMFSNLDTEEEKLLAEQSVFKWYAVDWETLVAGNPLLTPEYVLPFLTKNAAIIAVDGKEEHDKPYVVGDSAILGDIEWYHTGSARLTKEFELDKDFGIVKFKEPVYKVNSTGFHVEALIRADIDLVASFELKVGTINDFYRWVHVNSGSTEPAAVHQDKSIKVYAIGDDVQQLEALNEYGTKKLAQLVKFYQEQYPVVKTYPAILPVDVRGEFRSVRWTVDLGGGTTEIQKQIEVPKINMPTFKERLNTRKLKYLFGTPE